MWLLVPYMAVLAAAVHFLHFALFQEDPHRRARIPPRRSAITSWLS